ncbi:hypothetical protein KCU81_g325, partial [Aureobasidium melanogenum]
LKGACLRPATYDRINIFLFLVGISQVKSEWEGRTLVAGSCSSLGPTTPLEGKYLLELEPSNTLRGYEHEREYAHVRHGETSVGSVSSKSVDATNDKDVVCNKKHPLLLLRRRRRDRMTTVTPVSLHIVIHTCKPKRECGVRFGKGRYINHHVLYLDEGAKETWETFIIISSRHQEDREYGEGDTVPNAQNAECRMRLRCLRQVCMVKWMRKSDLLKRASFSCWALMKASLNRLASVDMSASMSLAGGLVAFNLLSLNIGRSVPDPRAVAADVGRELHVGNNVVVGADLQGLVTAHDKSGSAVLLVLEETNLTGTTLLPLSAVTVELEELGAHLEGLLLALLVCLGVDFLGKVNNGLEVDVRLLLVGLVLLLHLYQHLCGSLGSAHRLTSSAAFAAVALELPLGSSAPSSFSSAFSFLGPPPNMLKTLSLTAEAAAAAVSVACSVTVLTW